MAMSYTYRTPTSGYFHTPNLVWQVLTVLSLVYTSIFLFPYLLKLVLYPRKARKHCWVAGVQLAWVFRTSMWWDMR